MTTAVLFEVNLHYLDNAQTEEIAMNCLTKEMVVLHLFLVCLQFISV